MSESFSPPFVWPPFKTNELVFEPPPPWRAFIDPQTDASIVGVVWGLDQHGARLLQELITEQTKIKLVIAIYAASPTDQRVLEDLLQLASPTDGRAEFALFARSLDSNAASMSALLVSNASGRSHIWIGNTPNFGCKAEQNGHLNLGFEANQVLTGRFIEWFVDLWMRSVPLTPLTARVPPLAPARGSEEAAESWISYENLCSQKLDSPQAQASDRDAAAPPAEDQNPRATKVADLCSELKLAHPDALKEKVVGLLAQGEIITIDKASRTPPMELPVRADWFGGEAENVGAISRKSSYRIRIFDENQSKELEARRNGLSDLIQRLTYPLADGMRWIPQKAQPLLERERARLEKEAQDLIQSLVGSTATRFAASRREAIEQDANEMYKKVRPGAGKLPVSTLNLILRDLEDRLTRATQGDFLPRVTYMSTQLSTRADSEHLSQWAQIRTLLTAAAEYFRKAVTTSGHLKGIEIPEEELLAAMDVCGDWIIRESRNSKTDRAAKSELLRLQEIQESDLDDRRKCELVLALIEHRITAEPPGYAAAKERV
jgi:hypothetical protein